MMMVSTPALASSVAEYATIYLGGDTYTQTMGYTTYSYTYLNASIEIPLAKTASMVLGFKTGNNYTISELGYSAGFKFELK